MQVLFDDLLKLNLVNIAGFLTGYGNQPCQNKFQKTSFSCLKKLFIKVIKVPFSVGVCDFT